MISSLLLLLAPQCLPDIAVFVMDDVASADLALYGGPVSCPNLETLAAQGVNFTRAYSGPTCAPSRRSMLTGHWWVTGNGPSCPGSPDDTNTPQLSEAFLPECLPSYTSGISGKWHLGVVPGWFAERAPIVHGFDFYVAGSPTNVAECGGSNYTDWLRIDAQATWHQSAISTVYQGIAIRQAFNSGWPVTASPKLAYICQNLAHAPFHAPPSNLLPPGYVVPNTPRGRYEAMILAWDTLLGQMLSVVDLQTTLVVVVSDNGTPPNLAPDPDKAKGTTFERGVRVPMVFAGCGVSAPGRSVGDLVHLVDVWATLVEVGSGSVPGGSPWPQVGVSLKPFLEDLPQPPSHEFVLTGARWGTPDGDVASVRADMTKLRLLDDDGDGTSDREEFYDLSIDPGETTSLVSDPAYAVRYLEHLIWISQAIP
jgi:arylsulfatase A-like enzyme